MNDLGGDRKGGIIAGADDPAADPIRRYRPGDRENLYRVCLQTGDSGRDATVLYRDPDLLGEVFVGPYVALQPQFAFVLDDGHGAEGYVLGALDTESFHRDCEAHWWPALRERYRDVVAPDGLGDGWLLDCIRHPSPPSTMSREYPSHLHIDLLPRWQGGGWGRRLMQRLWAELAAAGSTGVHLGVGAANAHAIGFYRHLGFVELSRSERGATLGRRLGAAEASASRVAGVDG